MGAAHVTEMRPKKACCFGWRGLGGIGGLQGMGNGAFESTSPFGWGCMLALERRDERRVVGGGFWGQRGAVWRPCAQGPGQQEGTPRGLREGQACPKEQGAWLGRKCPLPLRAQLGACFPGS